jgi:hypothetical protein
VESRSMRFIAGVFGRDASGEHSPAEQFGWVRLPDAGQDEIRCLRRKKEGRHRAAPHIDDDMSVGSSEPSERPYARVLGESCWRPLEPHGLASAGGIQ